MRRWLKRLGLPLGLAVLGGATLLTWPLVWPADPLRTEAGQQIGEATGYVVSLDTEAGVLKISSSIFGLRPVALAIDADTPITIRDKQGGLGDIAVDMRVRVAFEIQGQTRRARSVELIVPESESRDVLTTPASAPSSANPSVGLPPRVEPVRPVLPAAAVDVAPKRPLLAPAPATNAVKPVPTRNVVERAQPATPPPARAPIEDEKALEAADGTAAIDWLLRSRER